MLIAEPTSLTLEQFSTMDKSEKLIQLKSMNKRVMKGIAVFTGKTQWAKQLIKALYDGIPSQLQPQLRKEYDVLFEVW